ncbi:uncharacterized [Tachysurus ichikawai]
MCRCHASPCSDPLCFAGALRQSRAKKAHVLSSLQPEQRAEALEIPVASTTLGSAEHRGHLDLRRYDRTHICTRHTASSLSALSLSAAHSILVLAFPAAFTQRHYCLSVMKPRRS